MFVGGVRSGNKSTATMNFFWWVSRELFKVEIILGRAVQLLSEILQFSTCGQILDEDFRSEQKCQKGFTLDCLLLKHHLLWDLWRGFVWKANQIKEYKMQILIYTTSFMFKIRLTTIDLWFKDRKLFILIKPSKVTKCPSQMSTLFKILSWARKWVILFLGYATPLYWS